MEAARGFYRILADHGVDDQEDIIRRDRIIDGLELIHQRLINGETTSRIVDDDVVLALARFDMSGLTDLQRGSPRNVEHRYVELLAEDLELLHGRGALHVCGDEKRFFSLL